MKTRVGVGKPKWSNCHVEVLKLFLMGRVKEMKFVWTGKVEAPHLVGITRHGNMIHFKRGRGRPKRFSLLLWGRLEVVKGALWRRANEG